MSELEKNVEVKGEVEEMKVNEDLGVIVKAKYPKVYEISVELEDLDKEFTLYFKKPTTLSLSRIMKDMSKKALPAFRTFTVESIVDEQKEEFEKILEEYPALSTSVGGKLLGLLGNTDNVTIKKL